MLDDGLISKSELIEICQNLIKAINTKSPDDLEETFSQKIDNITSIGDKSHYEKLPLNSTNSLIDFSGLFSIFEVQKQNIINEYGNLMELEGLKIDLGDLDNGFTSTAYFLPDFIITVKSITYRCLTLTTFPSTFSSNKYGIIIFSEDH